MERTIDRKRLDKARALVAAGHVRPVSGRHDLFAVDSHDGRAYLVDTGSLACACPDALHHPQGLCKHVGAVLILIGALRLQGDGLPMPEGDGAHAGLRRGL